MKRQPVSERGKTGFHARIRKVAEGLGYYVAHVKGGGRGKQTQDKNLNGFPDLILVKPGRLVFVEVKGDGGTVSVEQAGWQYRMMRAGAEAYVWFPNDYEEAVRILAEKERP